MTGTSYCLATDELALDQKTIYVIDDDDAVRVSARMLLEAKDFVVKDFASPAKFLEETGGTGADCLLLDIHMPGLNGAELLESLRRKGIRVPAVILSGRLDETMSARLAKAGASAILEKPPESGTLLSAIRSAMSAPA